jgi:putative spermidine/putrescine transport system ATP-binding protein
MRIVAIGAGQQQRAALAMEPQVLQLDEPLAALTPRCAGRRASPIRTLRPRPGTATLFVTYAQEEALSMADRAGVVDDERLARVAAPSELYSTRATAFIAEFAGLMNCIPGSYSAPVLIAARR